MIIIKNINHECVRPDGTRQVVIQIKHGHKAFLLPTPIYTLKEYWDPISQQLSPLAPDYEIKNEIIESVYRRIVGKIQNFLDCVLENNLDHLLANLNYETTLEANECFSDLIRDKMKATLSINTKRGYSSFLKYIERRFGAGPVLEGLNQEFANKFIAAVDSDYSGKESMRRLMLSRFNAVVNYGRSSGKLSSALKISLPPYSLLRAERNLSKRELRNIFDAYYTAIVSDPQIEKPETMALGIFIIDIAFQGLAPVDLAHLKIKDLRFVTLNDSPDSESSEGYPSDGGLDVVMCRTVRKKTGRPVHIVSSLLGIRPFLEALIKDRNDDDYLLHCFRNDMLYTPTQKQNRLSNYFNKMTHHLNCAISKYYKAHNLKEPRRVTYYFARHAFCNMVDSMDIPRHLIQYMVGHKTSVLETNYLRSITPWEQAEISHQLLSQYFR